MGYNPRGTKAGMANRQTCVYRFYNADGDLLYVGLSVSPWGRFAKHAHRSPWWVDVDSYAVEWFDNREAARTAETATIHHEDPIHNHSRPRMEYR